PPCRRPPTRESAPHRARPASAPPTMWTQSAAPAARRAASTQPLSKGAPMATSDTLTSTNPIDDVAGRAHVAVDQAVGKAAPVVERAQAAAHRTIDRVAETAQPAAQWA